MKSFISIIYLQTNSVSGEKIAVGLLAISEGKVFFQIAEQKIKLVGKLSNSDILKHAKISFGLINNKVNETNKENKSNSFLKNDSHFTKEYISYLNKYSKGIMQFICLNPIPVLLIKQSLKHCSNSSLEVGKIKVKAQRNRRPFNP